MSEYYEEVVWPDGTVWCRNHPNALWHPKPKKE
jgi:hypothetical protein